MTRGQVVTLVTLGCAGAIAVATMTVATVIFLSPAFYASVAPPAGRGGVISAGWLAALVTSAGLFVAYWLVRTQQAIAGWIARRELARLRTQYRQVELALGRAAAEQFLVSRVNGIVDEAGQPSDLFGSPAKIARPE